MRRLFYPLAAALLISSNVFAQSGAVPRPTPAPLSVVVKVTEGEPIRGRLISADSEKVVVDTGVAEVSIRASKVVGITYQTEEATPPAAEKPTVSKDVLAAEKIVSAMRRLENATAVGVTLQNYSSLMIESKSVVDEQLRDVPQGPFRSAIEAALVDHQYALSVWSLAVAHGWSVFHSKQEPGRTLITRYGVPVRISIWTDVPVMTGLNYVWLSARGHFNKAENLLRQAKAAKPSDATTALNTPLAGKWEITAGAAAYVLTIRDDGGQLSGWLESGADTFEVISLTQQNEGEVFLYAVKTNDRAASVQIHGTVGAGWLRGQLIANNGRESATHSLSARRID